MNRDRRRAVRKRTETMKATERDLQVYKTTRAGFRDTPRGVSISGRGGWPSAFYGYVGDALEVRVTTGAYRATGCYYGASEIQRAVTEAFVLRCGDELHVVAGGTFVVRAGIARKLSTTDPDSSPFERITDRPIRFFADALVELDAADVTPPAGGYRSAERGR